jgi:hypothetical protein
MALHGFYVVIVRRQGAFEDRERPFVHRARPRQVPLGLQHTPQLVVSGSNLEVVEKTKDRLVEDYRSVDYQEKQAISMLNTGVTESF